MESLSGCILHDSAGPCVCVCSSASQINPIAEHCLANLMCGAPCSMTKHCFLNAMSTACILVNRGNSEKGCSVVVLLSDLQFLAVDSFSCFGIVLFLIYCCLDQNVELKRLIQEQQLERKFYI